ncbi:hypothetical protein BDV28DRAFT_144948 [Aspergillus coremiiformis]|uniref:Uncharacterized protein n=1 Tax=Aspergillus coremiiformis TaxID=138285 RepID=A0A5N6ZHE3_9EURO|nr:hypothetical protein BDV28DRAFT_144948 [Aspergillus coremiiformis]
MTRESIAIRPKAFMSLSHHIPNALLSRLRKQWRIESVLWNGLLNTGIVRPSISINRVREGFHALVGELDLHDLPEEDFHLTGAGESAFMMPPARNQACFIPDESDLSILADLDFPEDPMQNYRAFKDKKPTLVGGHPFSETNHCRLTSLPYIYYKVTSDINVLQDGLIDD